MLGAVLPSPFVVNDPGASTANSDLIVQSELVSTKPETIVYTLNPKAVWSDGVPITAADFKYAWEQQRGDPWPRSRRRGRASPATGTSRRSRASNGGHTVTVKFKTTFADWQMLFDNLLPAHVMEKVGWNPTCTDGRPGHRPVGRSVQDRHRCRRQTIDAGAEPRSGGGRRPMRGRSRSTSPRRPTQLAQWMASGYVQVAQPDDGDASSS